MQLLRPPFVLFLTLIAFCVPAESAELPPAPASPPPIPLLLDSAIASFAKRADSETGLPRQFGGGPGYHTRTTKDQVVHGTHDAANYAQLLLMRGTPDDVARASRLLERLVALQVTDPASKHYGIWGWFVEEPPAQMAPADWNWADFIGARFVEILKTHSTALDPSLAQRLRDSLGHACRAIVKRNVGPGYTNICAMGAAVTLAAGELLEDPALVAYGRNRLAAQRAAFQANGGVAEYNSPAYGLILLRELERIHRLVNDPAARADADWMRRRLWQLIASQYHPGTGQWAGAQDRYYNSVLRPNDAFALWQRTGIRPRHAANATYTPGPDSLHPDPALACPPEFVSRFAALSSDPEETRQTWLLPDDSKPAVILHSWFTEAATLGTVNQSTTWVQHRPLTAYWRETDTAVASALVSFLKDGREFAAGRLHFAQKGPRTLAVFGLASGQGEWHVSLDRPADGRYTAQDLRLRILLRAASPTLTPLDSGAWSLAAGPHRLIVHPGEIVFDGRPGRWETGANASEVYVDAVLHSGSVLTFSPRDVAKTLAAFGLELLDAAQAPSTAPLVATPSPDQTRHTWNEIPDALLVPDHASL